MLGKLLLEYPVKCWTREAVDGLRRRVLVLVAEVLTRRCEAGANIGRGRQGILDRDLMAHVGRAGDPGPEGGAAELRHAEIVVMQFVRVADPEPSAVPADVSGK